MRNLVIYIAVIAGALCSCTSPEQPEVNSVLFDITDEQPPISMEELDMDAGTDIWKGRVFRISWISDVDVNRQVVFEIEGANELLGNVMKRKKEFKAFQEEVQESTALVQSQKLDHSSVWIPLVKELCFLKETYPHATLHVYSDLLEHNDWISFYEKNSLEDLEAVKEKYQSLIPDSTGQGTVSLVIHNTPKNQEDNVRFRTLISKVYEPLMKEMDITVKTVGR